MYLAEPAPRLSIPCAVSVGISIPEVWQQPQQFSLDELLINMQVSAKHAHMHETSASMRDILETL